MKKIKFKYIILSIFALFFTIVIQAQPALAASGSITASGGGTFQVGDTVSITLNVKADETLYGVDVGVNYDASVLEYTGNSDYGGNGTLRYPISASSATPSVTINFKAKQAGTSSVSLSNAIAVGTDEFQLTASGTSVTVAAPSNYSKDNSLKSLKISPGTLSPAFTPHTVNYTATVPNSTTKLTVDAQVSNPAAKVVSVTGANSLSVGRNDVKILVEAEDGSQATYTIVVTREQGAAVPTQVPEPTVTPEPSPSPEPELPPITVNIDGKTLQIKSDFEISNLPESFKTTNFTYDGNEVIGATSLTGDLNLLYLTDANGENGDFYIYDEESNKFDEYIEVEGKGGRHIILPYDESLSIPDNFVSVVFKISGKEISGWQLEGLDSDKYYVIYAMNGHGNKDFYSYDTSDQTFQRLSLDIMETLVRGLSEPDTDNILEKEVLLSEEMDSLREEHNEEISFRHKIIIALAILSAVLLIILINVIVKIKYLKDDLAEYDDSNDVFASLDDTDSSEDILDLTEDYSTTETSKTDKDKAENKNTVKEDKEEIENEEDDSDFQNASLEEIFEFLNVDDIDEDDLN